MLQTSKLQISLKVYIGYIVTDLSAPDQDL